MDFVFDINFSLWQFAAMKHIKIAYPTSTAEAIRGVCYLRAWNASKLAKAMGLVDGSNLSKIVNLKIPGTDEMTARVLQHMPEKYRPQRED